MISANKKVFKRLVLGIILAGMAVLLAIYLNILYYGHNSKPQKADVIIVLGCHIEHRAPSLTLEYRLENALKFYKSGYAKYFIVSGGQGADEEISEASAMKSWLVNHGVESGRIIEENKSSNTYENIKFSKVYMAKNRFKSAIIVSNDFHMFRSLRIAKKLDVKASGAPAQSVWYLKPYYQIREILSIIKGFVLNRI